MFCLKTKDMLKDETIVGSPMKHLVVLTCVLFFFWILLSGKFDLKFLNYYLEALNLEPITNYICTLEMLKQVKSYNGKNKKLETACIVIELKKVRK